MGPTTSKTQRWLGCARALLVILAATLCAAAPQGPSAADHPPLQQWLAAQLAGGSASKATVATASYEDEDRREQLCFRETERCGGWGTGDFPGACPDAYFNGDYRSSLACCNANRQSGTNNFAPIRVQDAVCQVSVRVGSVTLIAPSADGAGVVSTGIATISCDITGDCGHEGCEGLTLTAPAAKAYLVRGVVAYGDVKPVTLCEPVAACSKRVDPGVNGGASQRWHTGENNATHARHAHARQRARANTWGAGVTACKGNAFVFEGPFTVSREDGRSTKYKDGWLTFTSFATDPPEAVFPPSTPGEYDWYQCGLTPAEVQGLPVMEPNTWSFTFNDPAQGYGRE